MTMSQSRGEKVQDKGAHVSRVALRRPGRIPVNPAALCNEVYVRFTLIATKFVRYRICRATDVACYSITSSARAISIAGISSPSAFEVLRFMTISNFTGCSTGMSAGLAPPMIFAM